MKRVFREGVPSVGLEIPWFGEDGSSSAYIRFSVIPFPFLLTGETLALMIVEDVTERRETEERILQMAYHDALTGLPNRLLFHDRLRVALTQAQRNRKRLAVMFLDLDRFKDVNDRLGHRVGDELLKSVGDRIMGLLRQGDTVARMGGDEFLLLLPEIAREEDAQSIAEKILQALRRSFRCDTHELLVTTSIGFSIYPEDGRDADALVMNADIAMYKAKECGRNTCRRFARTDLGSASR